jgi:hypothetical protein
MSSFELIGGIGVMGFLSPMDTEDTYAVVDPLYGIDGLRNVNNLEELNQISEERRRAGMIVGVNGGETYYKLKNIEWVGDITDWVELDFTKQISIDKEIPIGVINNINKNFNLSFTPVLKSEHVYLNGLLQDVDEDYTITGSTITFIDAPLVGMKIRCSYRTT